MATERQHELRRGPKPTAVLSCLNSGLYTGSRMLFALSRRGDAPKGLLDVNGRGVPVKALLLTTAIGFLSTILAWLSPETVFLFLVNSSGAVALFVYLLIAVAELRMRRRLEGEAPQRLKVRMWFYPWLTWASIVAIVAVIASMALVDGTDSYLVPSLISLAVVLAAAFIKQRFERADARAPTRIEAPVAERRREPKRPRPPSRALPRAAA
jgi:GABA permease